MKRTILMLAVIFAAMFGNTAANAQVRVNVNIGSQPLWGPTGYDQANYYYLPDVGAYFDIGRSVFVYRQGNAWQTGPNLPGTYGNIDLYSMHKVVINSPQPWMHDNIYRGKYRSYRGRHDQMAIRDSRDNRYFANPQHPHHGEWNNGNGGRGNDHGGRGGNGNGYGNGQGNGQGHMDDHNGGRR